MLREKKQMDQKRIFGWRPEAEKTGIEEERGTQEKGQKTLGGTLF